LDLAFDGNGLLLVKDKSGTLGGVRTGAFHITTEGRLQDSKGLTLQGYPLLPGDGTPAKDTAVQSSPPPSATFIGPLGALEDIQLIKPEPTPPLAEPLPLEEPDLSNPYGTGWTTRKEADGLYSFHSSANYRRESWEDILVQRTLVDSLGNEHAVDMEIWRERSGYTSITLSPTNYGTNPSIDATFQRSSDGNLSATNSGSGTSHTLDMTAEQMTITFTDTGAQLTLDISNTQVAYRGDQPAMEPGGTFTWEMPPMIFEEGTYTIRQVDNTDGRVELIVNKNEDGSFTGLLDSFDIEIYFDEEGRVSGYQLLEGWYRSGSDPRVGIKYTGSLLEGVDIGGGIGNLDLSSMRIINKTGSDLVMANGGVIKPVTSSGGAGSAHVSSGTSPSEAAPAGVDTVDAASGISLAEGSLGRASSVGNGTTPLSIDEQGVLSRLKDNGDWEPIYLLACGQFAAMNLAEERNGVYYATPASGALKTGVSGKDGMGTIISGTLERSTTDLAHELSEMIRAQHAYAANTKVLSTLDDMLTELERL
jgi:flagellar hook protein FlgE